MHFRKYNNIIIPSVLIVSLVVNILFILSSVLFDFKAFLADREKKTLSAMNSTVEEFRKEIADASFKMIQNGAGYAPTRRGHIIEQLEYNLCGESREHNFTRSEMGWMFYAVLEDAIKNKDEDRISELESIFRKDVMNKPFKKVDQSLYGMVAILLHRTTQNNEYKSYADSLYAWLQSINSKFGMQYVVGSSINLVDGVGMYTPFLVFYSEEYGIKEAYDLAIEQVYIYNKYGVDKETGMPCHGFYTSEPYIKAGSINWGRGTAWYALGLYPIKMMDYNDENKEIVCKFNKSILKLKSEDNTYSQFIGEVGGADLTATLPILYYLQKAGIIKLRKDELLRFSIYSHNGLLKNSSGPTQALNRCSEFTGSNPLAQAFMLLLLLEEE